MGEAADDGRAIAGLELGQARTVHKPGDDLADIVGETRVGGNDAVKLLGRVERFLGRLRRQGEGARLHGLVGGQVGDDLAHLVERFGLCLGQVVGHAADARVHVAPAQIFGRDLLAGGRLHQRRPGQEDGAVALDDDRLVGHSRDVGPAGGARAEHGGDLGDALRRHAGDVVEDTAEVVAVGEDIGLKVQERAARIDQIDRRQAVLLGDGLRPQVLLDCLGEVCPALDRRVVGDDHAIDAGHATDTRDDARAGGFAVVHVPRGQRR